LTMRDQSKATRQFNKLTMKITRLVL
jgi:hypothetical protein